MATKREEILHREAVKKMTDEELTAELTSLRGKHFTLRSQSVTEKVENHGLFGISKRGIARVLTEQNARLKAKAGSSK